MQETKIPRSRGSLLDYAVSKLSPDVFSHPVWIRFGRKAAAGHHGIVDDLLSTVENIRNTDPSTACQVLLLCAVYLNCTGQSHKALRITRQARSLAEGTHLVSETLWAIWGACAISVQQENYGPAAESLLDLQAVLTQQNEWILADFIDVLRQSLFHPFVKDRQQDAADLLKRTWDWLQNWGLSSTAFELDIELASTHPVEHASQQTALLQSFFSIQRWQGRWHSLMLAIRGELRLQWTRHQPAPRRRQSSFWESVLTLLRVHL